jgi:hypothetical protein
MSSLSSFDELIHRQVEQFNQQVEDAASFHKQMLKKLCAARIMQDLREVDDLPVRIRIIRPTRSAVIGSMFQPLRRAGEVGRRIARRILPTRRFPTLRANTDLDVIEGEYVVLSGKISELTSKSRKNKEEDQP